MDKYGKNFEKIIHIPDDLPQTRNTINFYLIIDDFNSRTYSIGFDIIGFPVEISVSFEYISKMYSFPPPMNLLVGYIIYYVPIDPVELFIYIDSEQKVKYVYFQYGSEPSFKYKTIDIWDLGYGDHTITLQAKCHSQYSMNNSFEFSIGYTDKLNLSNLSINTTEIIKMSNQTFTLSGTAIYSNGENNATIVYYFNENSKKSNSFSVEVDSSGKNFSNSINLPNDLPEFTNTIHLYLEKDTLKSRLYNISFEYVYIHPNISIVTIPKPSYLKNTDNNITVNGTVSDRGGEDQIDIYCKFDNESEIKMTSEPIEIIDQNGNYSFNFTIQIPSSFQEGSHKIYIWAVDSTLIESEHLQYEFIFNHNRPSISITTNNNQELRRGVNEQIEIKGNVTDLDGSDKVSIKYYFDDSHSDLPLQTITIYNSSNHEFTKNINIPSYLSEGIHKITIYCMDEDIKISNEETINFTYIFNSLSLIVIKEPQSVYHNKVDTNISVTGTFTNDNNAEHVNFYYVLDNSDRHEIENVIITNEHDFAFSIAASEYFAQYNIDSNHTIFIWIEDSFGKLSSNYSKTFEFVFNTPIISVSTQNSITFYRTTNKSINIIGTIQDSDCTGSISIFYKFDEDLYPELPSEEMSSECIIPFSKQIEFPSTLSESLHKITIYCCDERNKKSNEEHVTLYYEYNPPEIVVDEFDNGIYHRGLNSSIHLEGKVIDLDGFGNVTINFYIDNNIIYIKSIEILNVNEHPFTIDLEFPSELNESLHYFKVIAVDESNKSSNTFLSTFEYYYNSPSISLTTRDNQTLIKDVNKKFYIYGVVEDLDEIGTLTIKYKLDEDIYKDLASFSIYDSNSRPFSEYVPLDSVSCGLHSFDIYVVDDDNKSSSHQPLMFFLVPNSIKDDKHNNIFSIPKNIFSLTLTLCKACK